MKIKLENIKLELKENEIEKFNIIEFEKLVEGSFNEWTKEVSQVEKKEKINWTGSFSIESEDGDFEYEVNTKDKFITSLDLDGYLVGEKIDIDEDIELLLSSKHSYIFELLVFHEISKLKVLPEDKLKAVELNLFPKWASGYLADNLEGNKVVEEFISTFGPLLEEFEIVKKEKIDTNNIFVNYEDEMVREIFKGSIKNYINEEIFFIMHDSEYRNLLPKIELNKLLLAGQKFNPVLDDIYLYS